MSWKDILKEKDEKDQLPDSQRRAAFFDFDKKKRTILQRDVFTEVFKLIERRFERENPVRMVAMRQLMTFEEAFKKMQDSLDSDAYDKWNQKTDDFADFLQTMLEPVLGNRSGKQWLEDREFYMMKRPASME
mgnify:CR=1 FL=1